MLTDLKARQAKPKERDYKLADAGGLYLFITAKGFKSWRLKYRYGGKEKLLTFGPYPDVSLAEARDKRDPARRELRDGRDPRVQKLGAASDQDATFETEALALYSSAAMDPRALRRRPHEPQARRVSEL